MTSRLSGRNADIGLKYFTRSAEAFRVGIPNHPFGSFSGHFRSIKWKPKPRSPLRTQARRATSTMGRYAAVGDTGSTTGIATTILALLSAGTLASITLVGVHQLAPGISEQLGSSAPSSVQAPAGVKVTPRAAKPRSQRPAQDTSDEAPYPVVDRCRGHPGARHVFHTAAQRHRGGDPSGRRRRDDPPEGGPAACCGSDAPGGGNSLAPAPCQGPTPAATITRPGAMSHAEATLSRDRDRVGDNSRTARSHRGSSGCAGHDARNHRSYPGEWVRRRARTQRAGQPRPQRQPWARPARQRRRPRRTGPGRRPRAAQRRPRRRPRGTRPGRRQRARPARPLTAPPRRSRAPGWVVRLRDVSARR